MQEVIDKIKALSARIVSQQKLFDAGKLRTHHAALGLQQLKDQRRTLQGQLPPLQLA